MLINYDNGSIESAQIGKHYHYTQLSNVLYVTSGDADEISFILKYFDGIRKIENTYYSVITWTGDDAKFIVVNWNNVMKGLEE